VRAATVIANLTKRHAIALRKTSKSISELSSELSKSERNPDDHETATLQPATSKVTDERVSEVTIVATGNIKSASTGAEQSVLAPAVRVLANLGLIEESVATDTGA